MHQRVMVMGTVLLSAGMLLLAEPEPREVGTLSGTITLRDRDVGSLQLHTATPNRDCTAMVREQAHPDWVMCPVEEQWKGER